MSNNIINYQGTGYDSYIYGSLALIEMQSALGMANRVYRGYDPTPGVKGSVVQIRVPDTFEVRDGNSSAQDINPSYMNIVTDQLKEVKFTVSDYELSLSDDRIIAEHIRPAAYALAAKIDADLNALSADIPWHVDIGETPSVKDLVNARQQLFSNKVSIQDRANIFLELDPIAEANYLGLEAFSQYQGSGDIGSSTQITGNLGMRYGFNVFANQNVPSHTPGTCSVTTLAAPAAIAKTPGDYSVSTISLIATLVTGTLVPGDVLTFAGHSQKYAVTALSTASGNAFNGVTITPALKADVAENESVTVTLKSYTANLAFHRNAFALVMRPLSSLGDGNGCQISVVQDPVTGLALRTRMFYVGNDSANYISLDVLYGKKTLDPNKGCIVCG